MEGLRRVILHSKVYVRHEGRIPLEVGCQDCGKWAFLVIGHRSGGSIYSDRRVELHPKFVSKSSYLRLVHDDRFSFFRPPKLYFSIFTDLRTAGLLWQPNLDQFSCRGKAPGQRLWRATACFRSDHSTLCSRNHRLWSGRDLAAHVAGSHGCHWKFFDHGGLYVPQCDKPALYRRYGRQSWTAYAGDEQLRACADDGVGAVCIAEGSLHARPELIHRD
jgi:hypothetical protein